MNTVLELRPLVTEDAGRLYELVDRNRPELAKFWWEKQTQSAQDSANFITSVNELEAQNGAPTRGIRVDEKLVGVAALHTIDYEHKSSMMGYWIDKNYAGKGYATAAAGQLIRLAFDDLGLQELKIATRETNSASRGIAEKLGFQLVAMSTEALWQHEGTAVDAACYSLLSSSWTRQHDFRGR